MAINLVRARNAVTGAIAALSERALELGHLPGWEKVDGPAPSGPKPATFPPAPADEDTAEPGTQNSESSEKEDPAGSESANQEEV